MGEMTPHLEECLRHCPKGVWFDEVDIFPRVKRGKHILGRLEECGKVESKVDMDANYTTKTLYRVVDSPLQWDGDTKQGGMSIKVPEIPEPHWIGERCPYCNYPVSTGEIDPMYNGCINPDCQPPEPETQHGHKHVENDDSPDDLPF